MPARLAWDRLRDTVLVAEPRVSFDGTATFAPGRCAAFDPRAFHPGLDRHGRGALEGDLVGAELELGVWDRGDRQWAPGSTACTAVGPRIAALHLAISP